MKKLITVTLLVIASFCNVSKAQDVNASAFKLAGKVEEEKVVGSEAAQAEALMFALVGNHNHTAMPMPKKEVTPEPTPPPVVQPAEKLWYHPSVGYYYSQTGIVPVQQQQIQQQFVPLQFMGGQGPRMFFRGGGGGGRCVGGG